MRVVVANNMLGLLQHPKFTLSWFNQYHIDVVHSVIYKHRLVDSFLGVPGEAFLKRASGGCLFRYYSSKTSETMMPREGLEMLLLSDYLCSELVLVTET